LGRQSRGPPRLSIYAPAGVSFNSHSDEARRDAREKSDSLSLVSGSVSYRAETYNVAIIVMCIGAIGTWIHGLQGPIETITK